MLARETPHFQRIHGRLTLPRGGTLFPESCSRPSTHYTSVCVDGNRCSTTETHSREIHRVHTESEKRGGELGPFSAGSFQVHREVFLEHETSFTSAGPGLALSHRRFDPSPLVLARSILLSGVPRPFSTYATSLLSSRSPVANAPARSLLLLHLLQPLLPDPPLWSTPITRSKRIHEPPHSS